MAFSQFMLYQTLHYLIYLFAGTMIGTGEGFLANLAFNFITFFFAALIMTLTVKDLPNFTLNVLSISLSFNTLTYLLAFALSIPLPGWKIFLFDYALVTCLSILGIVAGRKIKPQTKE